MQLRVCFGQPLPGAKVKKAIGRAAQQKTQFVAWMLFLPFISLTSTGTGDRIGGRVSAVFPIMLHTTLDRSLLHATQFLQIWEQ